MLAKMPKAEGRITYIRKTGAINQLPRTQLKMDALDRKAAAEIFRNALNDSYSIHKRSPQKVFPMDS